MKSIKTLWVIVTLSLVCSFTTSAQVLKIENGISLASLTNNVDGMYDKWIYPYQISIGLDYMDHDWYALTSNIGYIRKGGGWEAHYIKEGSQAQTDFFYKLDYLTLNTTFRLKALTSDKYILYAGAGPRIDFLLKQREVYDPEFEKTFIGAIPQADKIIPGLKCEIGMDYTIGRYQVGLNASWLPSFTHVLDEANTRDRTFTIGLVLGYRLSTN